MPRQKPAAVDKDLIRDLAGLLDETGLAEIEIEQDGFRVRVARPMGSAVVSLPAAAGPPALGAPHLAEPEAPLDLATHPGVVKSPMVGTVYRSPAPAAAPFVEIGSEVKQGQTILIIEAMKTMNQIPSPRAGRVIDIMVADGQPVEYGEPLMVVE